MHTQLLPPCLSSLLSGRCLIFEMLPTASLRDDIRAYLPELLPRFLSLFAEAERSGDVSACLPVMLQPLGPESRNAHLNANADQFLSSCRRRACQLSLAPGLPTLCCANKPV
jgi:hypothetical protein